MIWPRSGPSQRKSFWTQLPGVVETDEIEDLFRGLTAKAPSPALRGLLIDTVKALPPTERAAAASEVQAEVYGTAIGGPGPQARDKLWLIVVAGFSTVLVGSFLALAVGVFVPASGKVQPELILALFTSVVGFLAGLFVPSPAAQPPSGRKQ